MKHIHIIGNNLLKKSIREQFRAQGAVKITEADFGTMDCSALADVDEFVIFSSPCTEGAIAADNKAMEVLKSLAKAHIASQEKRPTVHLLLQSQTSLWMLQTLDIPEDINEKFEVYPSTLEDTWAKNVLVQIPGVQQRDYPVLDRTPIGKDSNSFVHVVISGFNTQAEAIALHTALTAHYPNYKPEEKVPLRTRITIIEEDVHAKRDRFIAQYQHLFEHSFYRTISIKEHSLSFHRPLYEGKRTDFVDVEWEFVEGYLYHPEVKRKLELWTRDDRQQLTVFICHEDDEQNLTESMALPGAIYEKEVPILVQLSQKGLASSWSRSALFQHIHPFGMQEEGYDISLPLIRLAKYLKYFYDCSYGNIGVPTELPLNQVEKAWREEKSFKMRFSNVFNVMTISAKMRSLGHNANEADKFYALNQEEIELLAETEHNRWSVERLILGTRPCTDEELTEIRTDVKRLKKFYKNKNIHFDLRAFSELEEDGTGKNARVYDYDLTACIPLIVKTFIEKDKHGA